MAEEHSQELKRGISWREGLFISTGVPVLVLPSIGFFGTTVWAFSIVLWIISIAQSFIQCTAYGELGTLYKDRAGLPGFVYESFKRRSRLIPAIGAWGYWAAWNPVLAVNALLLGDYLHGFVFPNIPSFTLSLVFGILMIIVLLVINYYGLQFGSWAQAALAVLSLVPLVGLSILPFFTGDITYANFRQWLPPEWDWGSWHTWLIFLGLLAIAQWSANGWECAAVYAAEYREPAKDTPKALFAAGGMCAVVFPLAQAAAIGVLGVQGLQSNPYSPFVPISQMVLGHVGSIIAMTMLIASLILLANTALMGSSRALYEMARDGQIPGVLGRLNKHGSPFIASLIIAALNVLLILMKSPILVIAASGVGYILIVGLSLFGFVISRIDDAESPRPFKAPKGWVGLALLCGILNIPLFIIGNAYLNGIWTTVLGTLILLTIVPLYYLTQRYKRRTSSKELIA